MKQNIQIVLMLFLIASFLISCGPSQVSQENAVSQSTANRLATQTAPAPTMTPIPTDTATPLATSTPVPSATPNKTQTAAAGTREAFLATHHVESTATAASALSTQQALDNLWVNLINDGSITLSKGRLYIQDDFEKSWAQRNWYRWWSFGNNLSDFVIKTHIDWNFPEDGVFGVGGCGFVFRIKDENNHLVIFLTPRSNAALGAMSPRGFQYQNYHWSNPDWPYYDRLSTGSADFIVIAEKEFVTAYINGEKIYQWYVALTSSGDLGYTIVSGTNKDYGINCKFTNTLIWELVKN